MHVTVTLMVLAVRTPGYRFVLRSTGALRPQAFSRSSRGSRLRCPWSQAA
jgi:hypothetical protein